MKENYHRDDPNTSKIAALKQQYDISEMQAVVFRLFIDEDHGMTDSELCALYHAVGGRRGYPDHAYETPRKRRSDLARRGLLIEGKARRPNQRGQLEVVWEIA